jgi:hypothetical protein
MTAMTRIGIWQTGQRSGSKAGLAWNSQRTSLENWGNAPTRIEPVKGRIALTDLVPAREVTAQLLDGAGQPLGQPLALARIADGRALDLGEPAAAGFVLTVSRSPF